MALRACAPSSGIRVRPSPAPASPVSCAAWVFARCKNAPSFPAPPWPIPPPFPPNLLLNAGPVTRPDQVWVTDITYILTGEGWLYLAAVMDLHTRRILGWATADHLRTSLVTEAIHRARFTRSGHDPTGTILHSDRGCQYTSAPCRQTLRLLRMTQSMSRRANCYDNAAMESFWASLKTEALTAIPSTHANARLLIHDYIDAFYNTRRLHSSLGFQPPIAFESSLLNSLN